MITLLHPIWLALAIPLAAAWLPGLLGDARLQVAALSIGLLGLWRYAWWFTHLVRALIYRHRFYPALRALADEGWRKGVRP